MKNNLILIGMPGAGKSTIGVLLAKETGLDFVDTDLLVQKQTRLRLQELINLRGLHAFRNAEEQMLLTLNLDNSVIATGGSVIYSQTGMAQLKKIGKLIYLDLSFDLLQKRLTDIGQRGIMKRTEQNLTDLFTERTPLYLHYADYRVNIDGLDTQAVLQALVKLLHIS